MSEPSDDATPAPELLRTTSAAVYQMVARGHLPGVVHIGRRVLVRRDELRKSVGLSVETKASAGVSRGFAAS